MIEPVIWNNGSVDSVGQLALWWYIHERESKDIVKRSIGLIYPSDYNYAVASTVEDRIFCLKTNTYHWTGEYNEKCIQNDWINKQKNIWTLTPTTKLAGVLIRNAGAVDYNYDDTVSNNNIFPALYLKPSVKISSGDGSEGNAYQIYSFLITE